MRNERLSQILKHVFRLFSRVGDFNGFVFPPTRRGSNRKVAKIGTYIMARMRWREGVRMRMREREWEWEWERERERTLRRRETESWCKDEEIMKRENVERLKENKRKRKKKDWKREKERERLKEKERKVKERGRDLQNGYYLLRERERERVRESERECVGESEWH